MDFDAVYAQLPDGWLTEAEARLLWNTVNSVPKGPVLEVGCYKGRSTVLLGLTRRTVYAVDPFKGFDPDELTGLVAMRAFLSALTERELHNVELFCLPVEQWKPRPVQFAYLDGDHTYEGTLRQIDKALECKPTAVALHDVNDAGGGRVIKQAALERLGQWAERVERLAVWRLT